MQPLLIHVPPNRLRSIIATFIPVPASRTARDGPAWPVPITIASYLVAIGHTSTRVTVVYNFQGSCQPLRTTCTLRPRKLTHIGAQDRKRRTPNVEVSMHHKRLMMSADCRDRACGSRERRRGGQTNRGS